MQITHKVVNRKMMFFAWMRLIRLPNIVILALIIILLHVGVYVPLYASFNVATPLNVWLFVLFLISVTMIASGGNIINDYFDVQIDLINKPDKVVISKEISKETAMTAYLFLTIGGIAGGFITGWFLGVFKIGFFFGFGALMLFSYSETFKRKLLIGNLIIAVLGFLFILLLWIIEFFALRNSPGTFVVVYSSLLKINVLIVGYALFAFLTTLIREIIKDIEDMEGDKSNGCQTLPISSGIHKARMIVNCLIAFTFILLMVCQYFCWINDMKVLSVYIAIAIQFQFVTLVLRFFKAQSKTDYHAASTTMKWIMVAGIVGIQLINIHF